MRKILTIFILIITSLTACQSQTPTHRAKCENPKFDKKVASYLSFTVPTISPNDVKNKKDAVILDAREIEEYNTSHLPNALFIGYNDFQKAVLNNIPKDKPIVVYCSIGYRSEKIGEKLQKMGFKQVYNLYGSIFEWVNQGNEVVDNQGVATLKVHTYNRAWSKWVEDNKAEKVW
jgi:rhodanese-related sulfurtransferase